MMTSVTLPSNSGQIHGGFASATAGVTEDQSSVSERSFEAPRPAVKRCLAASLATESCKKRRKQSTPVRISAADSPPEGKPSVPPSPEPELQCPICQVVYNNPEILQSHISTEHVNDFECKREPSDSPTPRAPSEDRSESPATIGLLTHDHQLASITKNELWMQQQSAGEISNKEWMSSPNMLQPFTTSNHMFMGLPGFTQHDSLPPRQPIRIFNPDAYCELCNKEFCNKYFLKTHKANKHGIYTDPPASESSSSSLAAASSLNISSFGTNMKIPTSVPSVDHQVVSIKIEPKTSLISPYPEVYSNPFVNKIFPKLTTKSTTFDVSAENADNSHNSNMTTTSSNGLSNQSDSDTVRRNDESPDESQTSPRHANTQHHDLNALLKQEIGLDQEGLGLGALGGGLGMFYSTPSSKMSPGQQARELDLSNRLRRIGVMNPKAFCEICCKEYCNKYFLRTHKMKRHGIFIPDDRDKDMKMDALGMPYIQTSPLNLIMAEQSNSSSQDRKTSSSPAEPHLRCDICGIKFQNMSLFQLHNVSMHAKLPTPPDSTELLAEKTTRSAALGHELGQTDSISEDLQKLQTMILQLNDLDVNKASTTCNACNKEFENRYYLHAHMMTEHGLLLDDSGDAEKAGEAAEGSINNNTTMCDLCGKDFHNYDDMKKHIIEAHAVNSGSATAMPSSSTAAAAAMAIATALTAPSEIKDDFNNGFTTPEKASVTISGVVRTPVIERRASMNLTPTSSYCEICNKELCNKYFMKTHMQRMHGIEIENGAQIGGVVCDICNKELCSKYFLRVHKHNTHGIVEYGTSLLQPRQKTGQEEPVIPVLPAEPDPALKPTDLADLSHRYFTHFTEVCTICSRRFRSTKWLKAHLLSDHGQKGADKWAEIEQQLQHTMKPTSHGERISPTLKIPNSNVQQQTPPPLATGQDSVTSSPQPPNSKIGGFQNVLSSIFGAGAGTDESATKTYHCSYCSFSTPVLPFLFVHERSHSLHSLENNDIPLKCPVCSQTFPQPDILQHHMFTQHPFLPLPPFFNGAAESQQDEMSKEEQLPSECNSITNDETAETGLSSDNSNHKRAAGDYVGLAAAAANSNKSKKCNIKQRKQSSSIEQLPSDVEMMLKDVAKKTQLPVAYALPQLQQSGDGGGAGGGSVAPTDTSESAVGGGGAAASPYVMQAFLMEEPSSCSSSSSSSSSSTLLTATAQAEHKFVPSIVFLPVLQKLSAPITATFTLTPA